MPLPASSEPPPHDETSPYRKRPQPPTARPLSPACHDFDPDQLPDTVPELGPPVMTEPPAVERPRTAPSFLRASFALMLVVVAALPGCASDPESSCAPDVASFEAEVWTPVLSSRCVSCHSASGIAAGSSFVLSTASGAMADNLEASIAMVTATESGEPLLIRRAVGTNHPGGATVTAGSAQHTALVDFAARVNGTCDAGGTP